ncbi:hypothetical protein [Sphaerisporangium rubeum]|uniref:Uncharacterized protein n=1 Tax=Sphaerisporangium rubeum TaxID=321317 RepID=A0A7X0IF08_9ACTN|nr:hypothetical protein [Sphaerisporangium rubeum]MBB6473941.1 hypothetical protein [Sphaerisporangium rubeum]
MTVRITVVLIVAAGGMATYAAASAEAAPTKYSGQSVGTPVSMPGQPAKLHGNTPWG